MAYMSQERKAALAPQIKAALKKYGMKGTIAVRHHSTLVINIKSGKLDMIGNYNAQQQERQQQSARLLGAARDHIDVNPYWFQDQFTGEPLEFLKEIFAACNQGNHDRSDIQTDYFDVGWYVDVNIGTWNKPYTIDNT